MTQFISTQKFELISPRKLRPVVDMVKKLSPMEALEVLPYVNKKGAKVLYKVVRSAVANATQQGVSNQSLKFQSIQIGEGPRLKRGQPVSRGMWHPIKRRMSHVRVVLESEAPAASKIKSEAKPTETKTKKAVKKGAGK